ncbi:MAG: hypothetical protein QNL91_01405 [Candidatus Krumholzibacteria bacterium]|nr:hypothetical protein [Candidatus Krumholzibacteria bacterium]
MITAPEFDRPTSRYLLNVLLISLAATGLVGLFDSGQFYVFQELGGKPVTWQKLVLNYLPFWWTAEDRKNNRPFAPHSRRPELILP